MAKPPHQLSQLGRILTVLSSLSIHLIRARDLNRAESLPSEPVHLRVEGLLEPVAVISEPHPRFSFLHHPPGALPPVFNVTQSSYRITVAPVDGGSGQLIWDSGLVVSPNCSQIVYAGKPLSAFTRYEWTVEWTSSTGHTSAQANARFETGLLTARDWHGASWFVPADNKTLYRRDFTLTAGRHPTFARAYVAATGCAHLEVNGAVPTPDLRGICPWTVRTNATRYVTHDITPLLSSGTNAVGLVAGHVMAGGQSRFTNTPVQLAVLLVIKYEGGAAPTLIMSGEKDWLSGESYVISDSAWETVIDWTKQPEGWSTAAFRPSAGWASPVTSTSPVPARALAMPLSTVLGEVKPVSVVKLPDGDYLYTFPKNFVGTVAISPMPEAADGSSVNIILGEWLKAGPEQPLPPTPPVVHCGRVTEKRELRLGCQNGQTIDEITFASFGTPTGSCKTGFSAGTCASADALETVKQLCIGRTSCAVNATCGTFGHKDPCFKVHKQLAAEVHCSGDPPGASCANSCYDSAAPPPPPPRTYPASSGTQQVERHILRHGNEEKITTLFCWHGFQFARVSVAGNAGFKGALDSIVGQVIVTNITKTGTLSFGGGGDPAAEQAAAVLDGVNKMTEQSQRTNIAAYMPTDCPTREKHGWMGDALDASEQALYNFEMDPVYGAFMQLIEDNQGTSGDVPPVIPSHPPGAVSCNDIAWTTAFPQIMEMQYTYYNDVRIIERKWNALVRYQENLITHAELGLTVCDKYKDWLCGNNSMSCCTGNPTNHIPDSSTCPVGQEMGGFSYVMGLGAMSRMASLLGKASLAERYAHLAEEGTTAFHNRFYNIAVGRYGGDINAVQSLSIPALEIGSPPPAVFSKVRDSLNDDLVHRTNYTLRIGAVTSKLLLNVLSENGLHETALRAATGTARPSWGYWWSQNMTTCAEAWTNNFEFQHGTLNHIFLCGGIGHWFWKHLVGLTPAAPGFMEVKIAPRIHDSLGPKFVGGDFLSPRGAISSRWNITRKGVSLTVSLPVGVHHASIRVPKPMLSGKAVDAVVVTLHGTVVWDGAKLVGLPDGVIAAVDTPDGVVFSTTNGEFAFESVVKPDTGGYLMAV